MKFDPQLDAPRPWQFIPPWAHGFATVPELPTECTTPAAEEAALQAAILRSDAANIAARELRAIVPRYPEAIRLALLRRHFSLVTPALQAIAANPNLFLIERVERRLCAQWHAAWEMRRSHQVLREAHCEVAFDESALDELAEETARLCREICMLLSCTMASADPLGAAFSRLRAALEGKLKGAAPLLSPESLSARALVYEGLAEILANAKQAAAEQSHPENPTQAHAYGACAAIACCAGVEPPLPGRGSLTVSGALNRLRDRTWWRRRLRRTYARSAESAMRAVGMVNKFAGLYVSDPTADRHRRMRNRTADYLSWILLVNEHGELLPLEKAYEASVSNPKLRRTELMTRMAGCERHAVAAGDEVMLCTVTLPSRFHAIHSTNGDRNARFDGSTPLDGHRQLQSSWAKVRASLTREGVAIYGFRCAEPNHDGTVHWHLMICVQSAHSSIVRETVRRYFLDELDPDEPGAAERRVTFIEIDSKQGSAVGYLAKYVSKNIDGEGVGTDREDSDRQRDAKETSSRAVAHARTHGVRQFQAFGLPPVTVWRELRRLQNMPDVAGTAQNLWRAADAGEFDAFIQRMGGPGRRCSERPARLHYRRQQRPSRYGEPGGLTIRGLEIGNEVIVTRLCEWRALQISRPAPTWTRGNNCTPSPTWMGIDALLELPGATAESTSGADPPVSWIRS